MSIAADSGLWVGTDQGLLYFHGGQLQRFTTADGLQSNNIRAVFEDGAGNVWVGTEIEWYLGGLQVRRAGSTKFVAVPEQEPSLPAMVHCVGDTRTWLQIHQAGAGLPLAYFPVSSTTVVAGATTVTLQVAFSKPFLGTLTYQLGGTAIPYNAGIGDYLTPPDSVFVNNAATANISINLTPPLAVELNRTLLIALSAPSFSPGYTISTNSVAAVHIVQSAQGVYVGTLTITNGVSLGTQSVKMAIRPGPGNSTMALFDFGSNPLLGGAFSVPIWHRHPFKWRSCQGF